LAILGAVADDRCLTLQETIVRPFPDLVWCRVDIGEYRLEDPECGNREILTSLLRDERAAHSYIAPRPSPYLGALTRERVHGPYLLSELDADSFVLASPEQLWSRLEEFVSEWHPVGRTLADLHLDDVMGSTLQVADSVYRLKDDETKFHPRHAQLPTLGCFSEFVVIAHASRRVLDIITAQD
jgi:hypothetical protein